MADPVNVVTVLVSLASSLVTAVVGNLLTGKKTRAEIAKIKAETDKIIVETRSLSTKVDAGLPASNFEIVYYDGQDPNPFDFEIIRQKLWDKARRQDVGEAAGGDFSIIKKVINLERSDNKGRMGLTLINYFKDGEHLDHIKADPTLSARRKIKIYCEIKSLSGKRHTVDFVLRDTANFDWISNKEFTIASKEWIKVEAYLLAQPERNFKFKIYDRDVESPPNSIQIRNLKLSEML